MAVRQGAARAGPGDNAGSRPLRREIGLFQATVSGTGVIIGAGVYGLVGEGAALAGNGVWLGFLLASVVAGLSALTYSRMGARVTKDSPEFQYASHGLGFTAGFVAGWLMLWADTVAAGAVALAFGGYFAELVGVSTVVAALCLVALLAVVVYAGINQSILVVAVLTTTEVLGLVFVTVVGLPHWGDVPLFEVKDGFGGAWAAASLVFFAYIGFDELGNLAEEMHRPEKDLPRAIILAMGVSTVLYVLVAVSAVSLIGAQALAGSSAPLADAVDAVLGANGARLLSVIALAATSNTVLLLMLSGSRSLLGMARAGALPAVLGEIGRRQTPVAGIVVIVTVVSVFTLLGDIALVAMISTFAVLVSFGMVNLSLVFVLERELGSWRAILRQPLSVLQPLLGAAACAALAFEVDQEAAACGLVLGVVGLMIAIWVRSRDEAEVVPAS